MFGHGAGNFMSRELGKKNYDGAGRLAVTSFVLSFFTGLAIGAAGLIFIEPLAKFLGSTDTILPYAKNYLKYILIASPFQTSALTLNNQLRFQGNTKHGLIGLGVGAVLNMGLDPLFILVFGMNTDGAGLATMISQIVSFCILVGCTFTGGNMPMKLNRFTLTKAFVKEIFGCCRFAELRTEVLRRLCYRRNDRRRAYNTDTPIGAHRTRTGFSAGMRYELRCKKI